MSRPFLAKYEYFWEYEYPFGMDFLQSCFDNYKRVYSLSGAGIYNIVFIEDKIYEIKLTQGKSLLANDNKKAFRDETKDKVMDTICDKLKNINIEYTRNSGKFITFRYSDFLFKIEIVKKAAVPA